ncbi:NUDIX domain-containing protein [Colwellia sp. D2M02]|uniref:NUDIX domain-containing protein n=1 Tax=Colwellia sp. D2M02 TaxID=2841562 RepID=UPI001C082362|nr:NUDIX domain-containing protein [Colwellia sp. D2M02]MBU2893393.1 NUDIX domain-containing protein [Colwellia sp. D2M02]
MTKSISPISRLLRFTENDVKVSAINTKYQGFFKLNEYQLSHQLFSGETSELITREVFERGDAVVVVAYDKEADMVLLIEQFRPGALRSGEQPWMLEFIAGMFSANESPVDVAIREAQEEAGLHLSVNDLTPIMKYLSSPGGMSECIHLYLADINVSQINIDKTYGLANEHEDIILHLISREQALTLLSQGKITNAATIIGLQWLAINYKQL